MSAQFTPSNCALLLIDHQIGTMQLIKTLDVDAVKNMAISLAKTAKILDIPTVITSSQEDQVQGAPLQEFGEILPKTFANRVQREGIVNAWNDENFKKAVEATGRKNLIMAGVTTDICLVFPTLSAIEDGYHVQAVMDASGSPFELSEETSRSRMLAAGVVLTATNTLIAELAQSWAEPAGQKLAQMLFSDILPAISS